MLNAHDKWELLYRPTTFEDVIGQSNAVEQLSIVARNKHKEKRAVILSGPHGCGKNTLAEIVGRAMSCLDVQTSGSPCGLCPPCKAFDPYNNVDFRMISCGERFSAERMREEVKGSYASTDGRSVKTLVFDEVHLISLAATDVLLKRFESTDKHTLFLLLTTKPDELDPPLRSRCQSINVDLLTTHESASLVARICATENVETNPEGVSLLVRQAEGHARDLVKALHLVAEAGPVTAERVRRVNGLDFTDRLVNYLIAVTTRQDFGAQIAPIDSWAANPVTKATEIQRLITHICRVEIMGVAGQDPLFSSIPADRITSVFDGMAAHAERRHRSQKDA